MRHQSMKFARPTLRCHSKNTPRSWASPSQTHTEGVKVRCDNYRVITTLQTLHVWNPSEHKYYDVCVLLQKWRIYVFLADLKAKWPSEPLNFGVFSLWRQHFGVAWCADIGRPDPRLSLATWRHETWDLTIAPGQPGVTGTGLILTQDSLKASLCRQM